MIQRMFVTIDTKKTNYKNVGKINHGDDLILELTVLSDGDMISFNNPMVDLLVKKSDGKMIRQNSGIEHIRPNKFIIEVSKDCVTSPGLSTNQLIINDNGRISTCMFYYTILSSLEEDIIESVSNVEVLEQLDEFTIQMKDKMENFDSELQNRMSELKNDIDDLVESFGATSVELQEAELSRNEAEQTRAQAESVRVQNESRRLQNDLDLANAEAERVRAENVRIQNETDRALVDEAMDQKESEREDSELERIQNESKRATNESVRQQNENTRQSNESIRMSNETDRKTQENRRVTAETNRVNSETTRRNNENSRISNEIERQKAMNEMKSLIDEANGFDERVGVVENEIVEINSSLETKENKVFIVTKNGVVGDGVTDNTEKIQNILDKANEYGSIELVFGDGVYIHSQLMIYPNTTFRLSPNAVLKRNKAKKGFVDGATTRMFINQMVDKHQGVDYKSGYIEFIGGTIDGSWDESTTEFKDNFYVCACMSFAHLSRLTIKDVHFLDSANSDHIIDCSGNNNVIIENCIFEGVTSDVDNPSTQFYTEMIEIDHSGGFAPSIDSNLPTKNVKIVNCIFKPNYNNSKSICCLPIGSHSNIEKAYDNIKIENCEFIDCIDKQNYSILSIKNVKNILIKDNKYTINKKLESGLLHLECVEDDNANYVIENNIYNLNFNESMGNENELMFLRGHKTNTSYDNIKSVLYFKDNKIFYNSTFTVGVSLFKKVNIENNENIRVVATQINNLCINSNKLNGDSNHIDSIKNKIIINNNEISGCTTRGFQLTGRESTEVEFTNNKINFDSSVIVANITNVKKIDIENNFGNGNKFTGKLLENSFVNFSNNDNLGYGLSATNQHSSIIIEKNTNICFCELDKSLITKIFYNHFTNRVFCYVPLNILCFNNIIENSPNGGIIMYNKADFINISNNIIMNPSGGQIIQIRNTPNSVICNNQLIKTDETLPVPASIVTLTGCEGAVVSNNYANCIVQNKINVINGFVMQQPNVNKQFMAYIGTDGTIQLSDITPISRE